MRDMGDYARIMGHALAGDLDAFTRARVGGTDVATTRDALAMGETCPLCTRPMIVGSKGIDRPEASHFVGAHHAGGTGGYVMTKSAILLFGATNIFIGCRSCNDRAGRDRRDILPTDLLHDRTVVRGVIKGGRDSRPADDYDSIRFDRLGW